MRDDLIEVLRSSPAVTVHPGSGAPEEWIVAAETELGIRFPMSYRRWLAELNDTWIAGEPVLCLAPPEFARDADTDIRYRPRLDPAWSGTELTVFVPDGDERYVLALDRPTTEGEVAVLRHDLVSGTTEVHADSFGGFLLAMVAEPEGARPVRQATEVPGTVSIWVGTVGDEDQLFDHVEIRYPAAGEPTSRFGTETGLGWYDEDLAEGSVSTDPAVSLVEHSYGPSFAAAARADLAGYPEVNALYLIYDLDATALAGRGGLLRFLGAYRYTR
ncbi:immunity 22 family protein [Micromonospora sp. CPCC 206060]|uniref:immunity 22 family protein n=1 Tax=Micromonospora sp. CPCC 206060 TaxID=3122406 RepID=UPI002FF35100